MGHDPSDIPDDELDLGKLALALVAPDHEGVCVNKYESHLDKIASETAIRHAELISAGANDDVSARLAALKYALSVVHDYRLDDIDHEILESADIMRVIDRGSGSRCAISLLYMIAARAQGWAIEGLRFPDYFLCRMEKDGERLIFDAGQSCKILEAHDLRAIVKETLGDAAELSSDYLVGLGARASLIHLCNFIKIRHIEMGDYRFALDIILRMLVIDPDEYRLMFDAGVLHARLNENEAAINCLNEYIERAPDHHDREEARLLLGELL